MPATANLLDRLTAESPPRGRGPCISLGELLSCLIRAHYEEGTSTDSLRLTPDHCMLLDADQPLAYRFVPSGEWASYEAIRQAFRDRNRSYREAGRRTRNTSPFPREVIDAPVKLLIRDDDAPIECVVTTERAYPKRAWIATSNPNLKTEWLFVIAGLLNSALGQVLYRRLAQARGQRGHELRKSTLCAMPIPVLPLMGADADVLETAALLSYRLHCLYAGVQACDLPAEVVDVDIRNHWLRLLSELVRLYGYSEPEARKLVEDVLPEGLRDVPGFQQELYYQPREPLRPVLLLDPWPGDRYEELTARCRARTATAEDRKELERLRTVFAWQDRINGPIPRRLTPSPWPGVRDAHDAVRAADTYLSWKKGQTYTAQEPRQIDARRWEVSVYYIPPKGLTPDKVVRVPPEWAAAGRHMAGKLWIDGVTGEVTEDPDEGRDAVASGH